MVNVGKYTIHGWYGLHEPQVAEMFGGVILSYPEIVTRRYENTQKSSATHRCCNPNPTVTNPLRVPAFHPTGMEKVETFKK